MRSNEVPVMSGRWKYEHRMNLTLGPNLIRDLDTLVIASPNDRFEDLDVGLDFEQDGIDAAHEAKVRRLPAGAGHMRFGDRPPARVAKANQRFDEASVRRVVDQGRRGRIQAESEVGAEHRGRAGANRVRNAEIASLQPADRGTIDPDGARHRRLRGAGTDPEQAELVAESPGGLSELAVAFVQRSPDGRC
jgi:hypothetical protein